MKLEPAIVPAPRSERLFARAKRSLVGGVDSPVRAYRAVGGTPRFIVRGRGPWIEDADGRRYLDYCGSWGALLLGHAAPAIVEAVRDAAARGTSFGAATEAEVRLAEAVKRLVPSIDLLRFVNSGTEATMSAVRVARGFTGRDRIVTFEGSYHGHADSFLAKAGSGVAAAGLPASGGVPRGAIQGTLLATYNDLATVEDLFRRYGSTIAAVVVEPVAGNMGVIPPEPGFLRGLRDLSEEHGALLVFDEVITGFRVARGGAQERFEVRPDLTCLGKILGHGLPIGAYGGRRDIMEVVAPLGPVYQAGTLAGNPIAVAAGLAALRRLSRGLYTTLERTSAALERGIEDAAADAGVGLRVQRVGSMLGLFLRDAPVRNFADARASDASAYAHLFWSLIARGVYLPPAPFETSFVSAAHGPKAIDRTVAAFDEACRELSG
ncbi:MAG TPA: glutamate-1-semialdehyde 2,1-aminomutase [Thermoplasmata archaeon]